MRVILYKSSLCPRCHLAQKALREIIAEQPGYCLETVDILAAPLRSWQDGIRMIPTLVVNGNKLSGILLTKEGMRHFLTQAKTP